MDEKDQLFPALSPDEDAGEDGIVSPPPDGGENPAVVSPPAAAAERPPDQAAIPPGPSDDPATMNGGRPGGSSPATTDAGRPAPGPLRGGGRGGQRAKVSWVGQTDDSRPASRKSWLGRISHTAKGGRPPEPQSLVAAAPASGPLESPARKSAEESDGDRADEARSEAAGGSRVEAAGSSGADGTSESAMFAALVPDPRDEVVFVPARSAPDDLEASSSSSLTRTGNESDAPEPVFPVARRRSPVIATATGVAVGLVALLCFYAGPPVVLALTSVLLAIAMAECYRSFQRARYQPAAALGLIAAPGAAVAAYFDGPIGLLLVAAFMVLATFCWYLAGVTHRPRGARHRWTGSSPVVNIGATVLGWAWIGLLGGFAGLLLDPVAFPRRAGLAFVLGAVEATVAYDVGGYLFGSWLGKRPLAPSISPKKTWEGLIGGCVAAFAVAVAVASQMSPWSYARGAVLGAIVVVVAPLGDLAESMVKRDLGLKDMGSLLPAHGGALDRIDGLLFVLPATYCFVRLLHW